MSKQLWIEAGEQGYVKRNVVGENSYAYIVIHNDNEFTVPKSTAQIVNPDDQNGCEDNAALIHLSEAGLLHNTRYRYENSNIHTYTGHILTVLNPNRQLPIYDIEIMKSYHGKPLGRLPPHVFAMGDRAYRTMKAEKRSQSILISGESGAGKTETSKIVMLYLVTIAGHTENNSGKLAATENKIIICNKILESFGNAKTVHNNNSSRFGKFTQIHFDSRTFQVSHAKIVTYLLEQSRVVHQSVNERNYHIFYQMCAGIPKQWRDEFFVSEVPKAFKYLQTVTSSSSSSSATSSAAADAAAFGEICSAFTILGIEKDTQARIFKILSGILHLGNIVILKAKRTDEAEFENSQVNGDEIAMTAHLLGVSKDTLSKKLLTRTMKNPRRTSVTDIPMKSQEAQIARDALAKVIFKKLFDWIVAQINKSLAASSSLNDSSSSSINATHHIGILDIFGFEQNPVNSFEQLCINLCNQKLQQHFNICNFQQENAIYSSEGIQCSTVEIVDIQACVDLIEQKPNGIFSLLDEECKVPKGTDEALTARIYKHHRNQKFFRPPPRGSRTSSSSSSSSSSSASSSTNTTGGKQLTESEAFTILHYAGEVCYQTHGFMIKNNDSIHEDLQSLMEQSKDVLLKSLFTLSSFDTTSDGTDEASNNQKRGNSRFQSICGKFTKQLNDLMNHLSSTGSHFIRCIKPNVSQKPNLFQPQSVLHQLRSAGMLDILRQMNTGFPTRCSYDSLQSRYKSLLPPSLQKLSPQNFSAVLLRGLGVDESQYRMGLTRVFMRSSQMALLETLRTDDSEHPPQEIVSRVMKWLQRRRWRSAIYTVISSNRFQGIINGLRSVYAFRHAVRVMVNISKFVKPLLTTARRNIAFRHFAATMIQKHVRRYVAVKRFIQIKHQLEVARREREEKAFALAAAAAAAHAVHIAEIAAQKEAASAAAAAAEIQTRNQQEQKVVEKKEEKDTANQTTSTTTAPISFQSVAFSKRSQPNQQQTATNDTIINGSVLSEENETININGQQYQQLQMEKKKIDEKVLKMESRNQQLTSRIEEDSSRMKALEIALEKVQEERDALHEEVHHLQTSNQGIERQLYQTKSIVASDQEEKLKLKQDIITVTKNLESLKNLFDRDIGEKQRIIIVLERDLDRMRKKSEAKDNEINSLREAEEAHNEARIFLNQELNKMAEAIEKVERENKAFAAKLKEMEETQMENSQMSTLDDNSRATLLSQNDELHAHVDKLMKENISLRRLKEDDLAVIEDEKEKLRSEVVNLQSTLENETIKWQATFNEQLVQHQRETQNHTRDYMTMTELGNNLVTGLTEELKKEKEKVTKLLDESKEDKDKNFKLTSELHALQKLALTKGVEIKVISEISPSFVDIISSSQPQIVSNNNNNDKVDFPNSNTEAKHDNYYNSRRTLTIDNKNKNQTPVKNNSTSNSNNTTATAAGTKQQSIVTSVSLPKPSSATKRSMTKIHSSDSEVAVAVKNLKSNNININNQVANDDAVVNLNANAIGKSKNNNKVQVENNIEKKSHLPVDMPETQQEQSQQDIQTTKKHSNMETVTEKEKEKDSIFSLNQKFDSHRNKTESKISKSDNRNQIHYDNEDLSISGNAGSSNTSIFHHVDVVQVVDHMKEDVVVKNSSANNLNEITAEIPEFSERDIAEIVPQNVFMDGKAYVDNEAIVSIRQNGYNVDAISLGSKQEPYKISLMFSSKIGDVRRASLHGLTNGSATCTCDNFKEAQRLKSENITPTLCKHIVAALLVWCDLVNFKKNNKDGHHLHSNNSNHSTQATNNAHAASGTSNQENFVSGNQFNFGNRDLNNVVSNNNDRRISLAPGSVVNNNIVNNNNNNNNNINLNNNNNFGCYGNCAPGTAAIPSIPSSAMNYLNPIGSGGFPFIPNGLPTSFQMNQGAYGMPMPMSNGNINNGNNINHNNNNNNIINNAAAMNNINSNRRQSTAGFNQGFR